MATWENNGMLIRADQMRIKTEEQRIMGSNKTDNQKAAEVEMLYRSYGLEPFSFYRPDFDNTADPTDMPTPYSDSNDGTIKFMMWCCILFVFMWAGNKYFPVQFEQGFELFKVVVGFIVDLIGTIVSKIVN